MKLITSIGLTFLCLSGVLCGVEHTGGLWRSFSQSGVSPLSSSPSSSKDRLHLSPYIKNGDLEKARELSSVSTEHMMEGVPSHAGYITVDERYNSNLFFWYFPVKEGPVSEEPLLIWLQGGPGCSSLFGLFTELGPFSVDLNDSSRLIENPYSWHNNHSLLFIDNPVGTGFSYTESDDGLATNQTQIGEQLYALLVQFLTLFPELQKSPLYIAGESYAGKYVPTFGYWIHKNNPSAKLKINLQGLSIGNGYIDPGTVAADSAFLKQHGIIDDKHAEQLQPLEEKWSEALSSNNFTEAMRIYALKQKVLLTTYPIPDRYNYVLDSTPVYTYEAFLNRPDTQEALHVGQKYYEWQNTTVGQKLSFDHMQSVKSWLEELLDNDYKIMSYSGQMDTSVPYSSSVRTYRSLKWKGSQEYLEADRKIWYDGDVVAGYVKRAGKFSELLVRNAGHMVPTDQPARALRLITSFTHNLSLQEQPANSTITEQFCDE